MDELCFATGIAAIASMSFFMFDMFAYYLGWLEDNKELFFKTASISLGTALAAAMFGGFCLILKS